MAKMFTRSQGKDKMDARGGGRGFADLWTGEAWGIDVTWTAAQLQQAACQEMGAT
jgi:hypothetical protein